MTNASRFATTAAAIALLSTTAVAQQPSGVPDIDQAPRIDVMFVLDTTGSMADLIDGAKAAIWKIATEIMAAERQPEIRMGLIGYRDRQDIYVTRHTPLSDDIDRVYADLLQFRAQGGGDTPESVNQALHEAVTQTDWAIGGDALRLVFLVGDAPPNIYQDDVDYPETARLARRDGIVLNTVLAGNAQDTAMVWRDIAQLGGGEFVAIPQSGGVNLVETPYDQRLQDLNRQLGGTALPYGSAAMQAETQILIDNSVAAPAVTAADISAYRALNAAEAEVISGAGDLIADMIAGRIELDSIEEDALPVELQGLDEAERQAVLDEQLAEREAILAEIAAVTEQRAAWLVDHRATAGAPAQASFDAEIIDLIHDQAGAVGIDYAE